ncbi:uncharacterized protein LOC103568233 [Microplitis demolitor]|uniref:uncharacterized protein LOC103568233 n=1 Tax=Microplitis demolitor TaxID=69319 RepID=UPI0004CD78E8|nr:uncharacterized protein LOC103568233 [Microplitis demolitor]XP_008543213.1 uncharacterized protein LOC103568233 [Microplitis demolitor]XP_008543214.1 uncharacterized protein LOC103568233 [Microplitis demolitor]XP_008543215.1 uncharacterized protein LOC103568233 [Microplitis demolitor]XP_008543216.1 uncharacterized protein LOC103568233 [Microplitis demolitor]XP_008543217.1 uncharacterized protein LOC103568233 [Microplitis demolitor]XP_008543218.1 uncharacterized protein LOC103568233 [Microp
MSRNIKDGPRGRGGISDNPSRNSRVSRNTNEEVQRAIEGLKDMPDDELQEFLDEDFMEGLNVVDAWDGEEEIAEDFHSRDNRDRDHRRSSRDRNRRDYRDAGRNRDNRDRDRGKRDERRREDRRDPSKSSQDIERDKIRTKRVNESKILAEKEKAIKHLLDSGTVVPPGTEVEIIENEKQMDRERDRDHDREQRSHRSRDRRRSLDRHRISPTRRRSHDRIRLSPVRRSRSPISINRRSSDRHRKPSWERHGSLERRERRTSVDRSRRRPEERDVRIVGRRSRSRDRLRSRSQDRFRRRWSRSPVGRRTSPRRRSVSKSPDHRRKRTPFIDELARQFRDNPILPAESINPGYMHQSMRGIQPQQQPPSLLGPGPVHSQMSGLPQHYMPLQESLPSMNAGPSGPPSYMPYESLATAGSSMNFEPLPMHAISQPDYTTGPVVYNQSNPIPMHGTPSRSGFGQILSRSPQPVPAPPTEQSIMESIFHQQVSTQIQASPSPQPERMFNSGHHMYSERSSSAYNGGHSSSRRDRLKTPEPPVISKSKQFEKTSLSSLLEASVSAKDTSHPVLYPGFKPDILRHCEMALRELPDEDPRLKIKGRFFFDPTKNEPLNESVELKSNSILLQKPSIKQLWQEIKETRLEEIKPAVEVHQKYCQTDSKEFVEQCTQTEVEMVDFSVQVHPGELQPPLREEKRPIMDRLDWNVRETYDYNSKAREVNDLRWSLSNSSQKRSWNTRGVSPSSQDQDDRIMLSPGHLSHLDHDAREYHHRVPSPLRRADNYSLNRGPTRRSFSPHERHFSPDYRHDIERQDNYHESRSERSHEPSPIVIDDPDEIEIIEQETFSSHDPNWRGRNSKSFGQTATPVHKSRSVRGKHSSGRSFRGRGSSSYRGKY